MAAATTTAAGTSKSFVTEVLATAGRLEKDDLNAKLGRLSKRIEEVKVEVYDVLQQKYGDFCPILPEAVDLSNRVSTATDEMQAVASKIEQEVKTQLNVSTTEFQELSAQLEESKGVMGILDILAQIHESQEAIDAAIQAGQFTTAALNMESIEKHLKELDNEQGQKIKVIQVLNKTIHTQKEKLKNDLSGAWSDNVRWIFSQDDDTGNSIPQTVKLQIFCSEKDQEALKNIMGAMHHLGTLRNKLETFCGRLIKFVIEHSILKSEQGIGVNESNSFDVVELVASTVPKCDTPRDPAYVFTSFFIVVEFLHKYLLGDKFNITSVKEENSKSPNTKASPLMAVVGEIIGAECLDMIIQECLAHSIPSSHKELESYEKSVIGSTMDFQAQLVKVGFIKKDNKTLEEYVKNVNILFSSKKCQAILSEARSLMTTDIHNTIKVSSDSPGLVEPLRDEGNAKKRKTAENVVLAANVKLSSDTFRFPPCLISVWVQNLMIMVYGHLCEMDSMTPECATQVFYSLRHVFEMYCDVVRTYHRESLETLPQLTALHHNNCMYIAHHLLTLGHQVRHKLPENLKNNMGTFVDLAPRIRRIGTESFLQQLVRQRDQLQEYIKSASGFINVSDDSNYEVADKAIKQALHHIRYLTNLWKEVLPNSVYLNAIGTLLNSVLVEILTNVTGLEDISADDATALHALCSVITEKSPEFFQQNPQADEQASTDVRLVHKNVPKWNKFKELLLVLDASLQDIVDRWSDSKGPLAHEFSADEVKQMVRALFQNTDRRAAVLAKIR